MSEVVACRDGQRGNAKKKQKRMHEFATPKCNLEKLDPQ
jgi:hypothetical protein